MNPAEIVVHVMERNSPKMILDLLAEGIRETGKAPHHHPHGQVLALHEAG
jgi:hypothetical protein